MSQKTKPIKKSETSSKSSKKLGESLGFGRLNYILMAIGLAFVVFGYIFLAMGSITLAPILLVLGYCVILPISILINDRWLKRSGSDAPAEN